MLNSQLASTCPVDCRTTWISSSPPTGVAAGTWKLIWLGDAYSMGDGWPATRTWTSPSVSGIGSGFGRLLKFTVWVPNWVLGKAKMLASMRSEEHTSELQSLRH